VTKPITIGAFVESLTRNFPGLTPVRGSSINGEVASVSVWEFHLHGSVTTKEVSPVDKVGTVHITFWQKEVDRARRPLKRDELTTTDADEMEAFVLKVAEWVSGVQCAIDMAFTEQPDDYEPEIQPGLEGLLGRGK
jgi:hypothetical protein